MQSLSSKWGHKSVYRYIGILLLIILFELHFRIFGGIKALLDFNKRSSYLTLK
jgi:hypothetical protein